MELKSKHIKEYGNVEHLLAAFAALQSVGESNIRMDADFGLPFTVNGKGQCRTVCNPAGWVAQHPHFRALGLRFEPRKIAGKERYVPVFSSEKKDTPALGYTALAYAMEMPSALACRLFSPSYYPESASKAPLKDVLRRLRTTIVKAGGGDSLKAFLKSQKAKVTGEKKVQKKKAPVAKKKAAKKK